MTWLLNRNIALSFLSLGLLMLPTPSQAPDRNTTSSTTAISTSIPFKTISYTDSFASIDKTLNLDLKALIKDTFEHDNLNSRNVSIKSIQVKTIRTSLYNNDNTDILIKAAIITTYYKEDTSIIFGFIKRGGTYLLSFKEVGWNKSSDIEPELIDIDSDGRYEIIIKSDSSGNQSTAEFVTIYKLLKNRFVSIFNEGLEETYGMFPYSYTNSFYFIKDSNNPKLLAIVYRIDTHFEPFNPQLDDDDTKAYYKSVFEKYGPDISKTFKGEYVFTFDGSHCICSTKMYDYRRYLRER